MHRIEHALPPSEPVEWHWPKGWEKGAAVLGGLIVTGVGAAGLGVAWWTDLISGEITLLASPMVAVFLLQLVVPLMFDRLRGVAVTARRVVIQGGRYPGRMTTVYRELLQTVAYFEGDHTLLLIGRDGVLHRARGVAKADELMAALAVPAVVWKAQSPNLGAKVLTVLPFILWQVMWAALTVGLTVVVMSDGVQAYLEPLRAADSILLHLMMVPPIAAMILVLPLSGFLTVAVGRAIFSAESLSQFLARHSDPVWAGRAPAGSGRSRPGLSGRFYLASARLLRARTVDLPPPEPEFRGDATEAIATFALAAAEAAP